VAADCGRPLRGSGPNQSTPRLGQDQDVSKHFNIS
jgi:hypothetical protein